MAIIDKDTAIKNLFWWNALCALFHGTQVVAAIIYTVVSDNAKDFRVPIITHYAIWNTTTGPEDATQTLGLFPLAAVTCAVPFLSFIAHEYGNMAKCTVQRDNACSNNEENV